MKLKQSFCLIGVALSICIGLSITSCNDEDQVYITVNGSSSTNLTFAGSFDNKSGIDFKQTITVKSDAEWRLADVPDWLSVSPTNGNGNVTMSIYPISENETSSPRTASLALICSDKTAMIEVTQSAGKPVCYVEIQNEVILYDRMCWEYSAVGNVNTFQWILLSENEFNRLTDRELTEFITSPDNESLKLSDDYISFIGRDSYGRNIQSSSTYYMVTLACDKNGKYGELKKTRLVTPAFKDNTYDAWVSFSDIKYSTYSFYFNTIKQGYCNTYHIIYGIIPDYYNSAIFAFQINYYLKHHKKHWFAENWDMEIVTNFPNNHEFSYFSLYLPDYPICFAYGWGLFSDGTLSSDLVGFQVDVSEDDDNESPILRSKSNSMNDVIIRRSEETHKALKIHKN